MDRTYPSPGFAESLPLGPPAPSAPAPPAPAAAQPPGPAPAPAPAWAYEPRGPAGGGGGGSGGAGGGGGGGGSGGSPSPGRSHSSSGSGLKASLNYGGGHSSQSETELLHRQNYGASHQLPGYAATHHSTGLSGIFDTNMSSAGTNPKESSVMNFLSAMESQTTPATSSGATLLPQFRGPSWQTGMHSSTTTELFVTGALPTTGTFPSTSTLSTYQHPNTFSNRNFATTPPLTLQDSAFSNTTNGILNPHDPLLQIKTSQGTIPTALAFERLGSSVLSTSMPPQSSTYRSAQESAPHLLQPQFSLLSSPLGGAQQASQAYSSSVFTGSTTSIERVLRECSVIKHHQRPSNTQSIQTQLTGSQHSLPSYFSNASVADFQDTTRQPSLSCNSIGDSTQVSNGGPQQKTSQVSVGLAQSYPSTIPSPSYLPTSKVKNCSTKQPPRSAKTPKPQSVMPPVLKQSYSKSLHNQSSVISGQAQIYSTAQLPSLLSVSQSQNYASTQSHNVPSIVHSQVYTHNKTEKLPPLYKTLTFSGQSQTVTSESQTISYSPDQQQVLASITNENYSAQTRAISSVSQSQSYSSGHSQGLSTVSQSQVSFSSQSQVLSSGSPSENYTSGQSLTLTSSSLLFSSSPQVQNLPASSSTQNYISMHSSQSAQTQGSSSPQSHKFLPTAQSSPFASPVHSQTLQTNRPSSDAKSYTKRKPDSTMYTSSKQEDDFPVQDLQVLQQRASLESPTQRLPEGEINAQDPAYRISKADDRYPQSVIRSNSCLEDQVVGVSLQEQEKEERMVSSMTHLTQSIGPVPNVSGHDIKKASNLMQTSQVNTNTKELNQQHPLLPKVHEVQVQEQHSQAIHPSSQIQIQTNALRQVHQLPLPNSQVLLESGYDLQIFQHSILQAGLGQVKVSTQIQPVQSSQQIVHPFLQMDGPIIQSSGGHAQQQLHPQNSEVIKMDLSESSKPLQQHLATKGIFNQPNQHDSKNQFVPLGSVCFPESILLSDERNILSNDDILAATAAACGVTPSDFAKSTANETLQTVENGDDPKSHFQQSADIRRVTPDFNSLTAMVGKSENLNNISLNGGQITINLSSIPIIHSKNLNLDQKHLETSDQTITPSAVEEQQRSSDTVNKASHITNESEEDSEAPTDGLLNNRDQEFVTSSKSLSGESAVSENEFHMASDSSATGAHNKVSLPLMAMAQPGDMISVKTEENDQDIIQFNFQKKRLTGKGLMKEDDNNSNQKQVKWHPQSKRQSSRGTDTCLPFSSSSSECCHDGYQHQEKMRQKIREVEEKQPEVKTGFIASFLDFLKSGPKQQFSAPAVRMPNRTRRPGTQVVRAPCHTQLPKTSSTSPAVSEAGGISPSRKIDELKKNFEALPSFSSDDEDSGGCSNDLQKSISTVLSTLDDTSDKKNKSVPEAVKAAAGVIPAPPPAAVAAAATVAAAAATTTTTTTAPNAAVKQESVHKAMSPAVNVSENTSSADPPKLSGLDLDGVSSDQLAKVQETAALEGCAEENSDSGGEGQYRERDEFVVKVEDIDNLKVALKTGKEPPAIWKVQKALLQKFVPEIRDGHREFAATNSYLGYFGDAKSKYRRIYVKFIENTNKKEYVRICSKKPRSHPLSTSRAVHSKPSSSSKVPDPPAPKTTKVSSMKSKAKQPKTKAEPPPKKRKKWKQELESSQSDSSPEIRTSGSEEEEFDPPAPSVPRFLNTRAMKETFRSYIELLVSIALDADTMQALEKSSDELLLPHMKKIDGMLNDNRRRLLPKLHLDQSLKNALESFPELTIITRDSKAKSGGSVSKIKMNGKSYNKKTLRTSKSTTKSTQEFAVDPEKIQLCSLYHSLHHYKYHIYLICKEEISSVQKKNEDLGQEEIVQLCMKNVNWVEDLFEKFGELLNFVQQKCS